MGWCCGSQFSRQQWFVLITIGSVHFASAICVSLQAPFYPEEAESKNVTATEYGFVFGIYELASFIFSPLLGNYIDQIGAKFLLNTGIFVAAICSILFGLLDMVRGHTSFIALSFIIRVVEAIGSSAALTSAFSITAATFPDNMATTFAALEIFYGLGYIVGPTLGGLLYALGGYKLPFLVLGSVMLFDGALIFFLLPSFNRGQNSETTLNILDIVKVPGVLLDSFSIASVTICVGFYSAQLEPHIRVFLLSPVALGFVFIVHAGMYAITAPLVGRLCDSYMSPRHLIMFGNVMVIVSVLFVGPAPIIPTDPSLPLVIVGLIFLGLGMSCVLVPAFIDAIRASVSYGFPDGITTYGLVSGLWAASFSLGDFIGPSMAGLLSDLVGFRWGSLFIVAVHIIVFTSMLIFTCRHRRSYSKPRYTEKINPPYYTQEREPIIKNMAADWTQDQYGTCSNKFLFNSLDLHTVNVK